MEMTDYDWRKQAQDEYVDAHEALSDTLYGRTGDIDTKCSELRDEILNDPDNDIVRERVEEIREDLVETAHELFRHAGVFSQFGTPYYIRVLNGHEPLGVEDQEDVKTQGVAESVNKQTQAFNSKIEWPLRLSEWSREQSKLGGGSTVSAEGTHKYAREVGGRMVYVIVDERSRDPF